MKKNKFNFTKEQLKLIKKIENSWEGAVFSNFLELENGEVEFTFNIYHDDNIYHFFGLAFRMVESVYGKNCDELSKITFNPCKINIRNSYLK